MSSEKKKSVDLQAPDSDYEARILDFLDSEISASSKQVPEQNSSADDVEAMVSDLLKQAIAAPDEKDNPPDTTGEDLESLLSGILSGPEVARPKGVPPESGSKPAQFQKSRGGTENENALHRPSESAGILQVAQAPGTVPYHPTSDETRPAAPVHPLPRPTQSIPAEKTRPSSETPAAVKESDPASPFTLAAQEHTGRGRMLATGAVFMFLLGIIGAGIYYFSASTGATSAKTDVSTASTVAAVPLPTRTAPPMQPPPTSAPAAKGPQTPVSDKPAREGSSPAPDTVTRPRAASAVAEKGKGTSSANTQEPAVPSPPPASIDALVPASTAATSSQLEAIARQNPVRNVEAPLQEIAVPPAVIAAPMPPPESVLGRPVPASTPNVLAMAALSREGSRASAAPKVDAAVLISKVSPVYPEVARRMRISGTVPVEIEIDENGRVTKATPAGGPPILRSAAVSAVLKWRFRPAAVNNTNIRSQGRVSIVFDKP